jgi:hypothetical protein
MNSEVALLYKAKAPMDDTGEVRSDFDYALAHLDRDQCHWLHNALRHLYPDHPWSSALAG